AVLLWTKHLAYWNMDTTHHHPLVGLRVDWVGLHAGGGQFCRSNTFTAAFSPCRRAHRPVEPLSLADHYPDRGHGPSPFAGISFSIGNHRSLAHRSFECISWLRKGIRCDSTTIIFN